MDPKLKELVNKDLFRLVSLINKYFKKVTVVLVGSFYYGEATCYSNNKDLTFLSDYDIFVVFDYYNPFLFVRNILWLKKFKLELVELKKSLDNKKIDINFIWKPLVKTRVQRGINEGKVLSGDKTFIRRQKKHKYFRSSDFLYLLEQNFTYLLSRNPLKKRHDFFDSYLPTKVVLQSLEILYLKLFDESETYNKKIIYEKIKSSGILSSAELKFCEKCLHNKLDFGGVVYNSAFWYKARNILDKTLYYLFNKEDKREIFTQLSKSMSLSFKIKNSLLLMPFLLKNNINFNFLKLFNIHSMIFLNKFRLVQCLENNKINSDVLYSVEKDLLGLNINLKTADLKDKFSRCVKEVVKYKKDNLFEVF